MLHSFCRNNYSNAYGCKCYHNLKIIILLWRCSACSHLYLPLRSSAFVQDRIITSSSSLSSSLTKLSQGLQQCSLSYCIAYHFKPLDAAPAGAARGLFSEKCCILEKSRKFLVKFGENSSKVLANSAKSAPENFGKKNSKKFSKF